MRHFASGTLAKFILNLWTCNDLWNSFGFNTGILSVHFLTILPFHFVFYKTVPRIIYHCTDNMITNFEWATIFKSFSGNWILINDKFIENITLSLFSGKLKFLNLLVHFHQLQVSCQKLVPWAYAKKIVMVDEVLL
jgi:hypothetical protein